MARPDIAIGVRVRAVANGGDNGGWDNPDYHNQPGTVMRYDGEYWEIRFDDDSLNDLGSKKLWYTGFVVDESPFYKSFRSYIEAELGSL